MAQSVPSDQILRAQVLGVTELPAFLGVASTTPHVWGTRRNDALARARKAEAQGMADLAAKFRADADRQLPAEDFVSVNGHKAWKRGTVVMWAARTNRLPPWLEEEGARWKPEVYRRARRTKADVEAAAAAGIR